MGVIAGKFGFHFNCVIITKEDKLSTKALCMDKNLRENFSGIIIDYTSIIYLLAYTINGIIVFTTATCILENSYYCKIGNF